MNQLFTCSWKKKTSATGNDTPILWSLVEDHGVRKALFYRPLSIPGGRSWHHCLQWRRQKRDSKATAIARGPSVQVRRDQYQSLLKAWKLNHTSRQREFFFRNLTYKCHEVTLNHVGVIASKISSPRPGQRVPVHWSLHQRSRSQDVPPSGSPTTGAALENS